MEVRKEGPLSQDVLSKIQEGLCSGEYKLGHLLPSERELSEKYGVGKSSVREAVKMLQILGIATSEQGKGTFIRKSLGHEILLPMMFELMMQTSNPKELYDFRVMFDCAYLPIAAANATDRNKRDAQWAFEEYKDFQRKGLGREAASADITFHSVMLAAAKNSYIEKVGKMALDVCRKYINESSDIFSISVIEGHEKVLEYFCGNKKVNLEEAVRQSLTSFRAVIEKSK